MAGMASLPIPEEEEDEGVIVEEEEEEVEEDMHSASTPITTTPATKRATTPRNTRFSPQRISAVDSLHNNNSESQSKQHTTASTGTATSRTRTRKRRRTKMEDTRNSNSNRNKSNPHLHHPLTQSALSGTREVLKWATGLTLSTTEKLVAPSLLLSHTLFVPAIKDALHEYFSLKSSRRVRDIVEIIATGLDQLQHIWTSAAASSSSNAVSEEYNNSTNHVPHLPASSFRRDLVLVWESIVLCVCAPTTRQVLVDGIGLWVRMVQALSTEASRAAIQHSIIVGCRILDLAASGTWHQLLHQIGHVMQTGTGVLADPRTTYALALVTAQLLHVLEMEALHLYDDNSEGELYDDDDDSDQSHSSTNSEKENENETEDDTRLARISLTTVSNERRKARRRRERNAQQRCTYQTPVLLTTAAAAAAAGSSTSETVHHHNPHSLPSATTATTIEQAILSSFGLSIRHKSNIRSESEGKGNSSDHDLDLSSCIPSKVVCSIIEPASLENEKIDESILDDEDEDDVEEIFVTDEKRSQLDKVINTEYHRRKHWPTRKEYARRNNNDRGRDEGESFQKVNGDYLKDSILADCALKQESSIHVIPKVLHQQSPPEAQPQQGPVSLEFSDGPVEDDQLEGNDGRINNIDDDNDRWPSQLPNPDRLSGETPMEHFYRIVEDVLTQQQSAAAQRIYAEREQTTKSSSSPILRNRPSRKGKGKRGRVRKTHQSLRERIAAALADQNNKQMKQLPKVGGPDTKGRKSRMFMLVLLALVVGTLLVVLTFVGFGLYGMYIFFASPTSATPYPSKEIRQAMAMPSDVPAAVSTSELVIRVVREIVHVDSQGQVLECSSSTTEQTMVSDESADK